MILFRPPLPAHFVRWEQLKRLALRKARLLQMSNPRQKTTPKLHLQVLPRADGLIPMSPTRSMRKPEAVQPFLSLYL
jgi:hypothetical protein